MPDEEKKHKNLTTYVICMILTIIILIIFAAMADNREELFESQIQKQEQVNLTIQNQIVSLTDENYSLKQEIDKQSQIIGQQSEEIQFLTILNEAWMLIENKQFQDAKNKAEQLKDFSMNEERKKSYQMLENALQ